MHYVIGGTYFLLYKTKWQTEIEANLYEPFSLQ